MIAKLRGKGNFPAYVVGCLLSISLRLAMGDIALTESKLARNVSIK